MRNLHITKPRGMNDANNPKIVHTDGGRIQQTTDGRDLRKGYDCIYPAATAAPGNRNKIAPGGEKGGMGINGTDGNR